MKIVKELMNRQLGLLDNDTIQRDQIYTLNMHKKKKIKNNSLIFGTITLLLIGLLMGIALIQSSNHINPYLYNYKETVNIFLYSGIAMTSFSSIAAAVAIKDYIKEFKKVSKPYTQEQERIKSQQYSKIKAHYTSLKIDKKEKTNSKRNIPEIIDLITKIKSDLVTKRNKKLSKLFAYGVLPWAIITLAISMYASNPVIMAKLYGLISYPIAIIHGGIILLKKNSENRKIKQELFKSMINFLTVEEIESIDLKKHKQLSKEINIIKNNKKSLQTMENQIIVLTPIQDNENTQKQEEIIEDYKQEIITALSTNNSKTATNNKIDEINKKYKSKSIENLETEKNNNKHKVVRIKSSVTSNNYKKVARVRNLKDMQTSEKTEQKEKPKQLKRL